MKFLKIEEIPNFINQIEYNNDQKLFEYLKQRSNESRNNHSAYIESFRGMVQLDEAVMSNRMKQFNLKNIKLQRNATTHLDGIFKVECDVR